MSLSVLFKTEGFFLIDHGQMIRLEVRDQMLSPILGLFHQPKQYFKNKSKSNKYSLRKLFEELGYPFGKAVNEVDENEPTDRNLVKGNQIKRRKLDSPDYTKMSWLKPGPVPSHKDSVLAQLCTEKKSVSAPLFPVHINKSLPSKVISGQEENNRADIHLIPSGIVNKCICNFSPRSIVVKCLDKTFLVPQNSAFLMSDIFQVNALSILAPSPKFRFIVLDPPWSNKSVKRSKHYSMLSTQNATTHHNKPRKYEEVGYMFDKINLPALLSDEGMIGMWVTNNVSHIRHVLQVLFSQWEVNLVAVCFWLKVTSFGDPIVPFDSPHKKPYELILIGKAKNDYQQQALTAECIDELITFPEEILDSLTSPNEPRDERTTPVTQGSVRKLVIASIPCVQHSRKPPLDFLYTELSKKTGESETNDVDMKCVGGTGFLELFARSLNSGWVSWGNEVLLFQDSRYFQPA